MSEWISISDRLPGKMTTVLVFYRGEDGWNQSTDHLDVGDTKFFRDKWGRPATHWMPLPPPPSKP